MIRGITVGKFYPPHLGHNFLIDTALAGCDELTVLVCDSPRYLLPAEIRKEWLQKIHPKAIVKIIPDISDDDNSEAWAKHTVEFLGYSPDIVFTSEAYGEPYAQFMNSRHQMVDADRSTIPIGGRYIRADFIKEWSYLHDIVKQDFAIRVVAVGAESTGTTTLAQDLAKELNAPWVPEYGRLYYEAFMTADHEWTDQEFEHIASTQQLLEKQVAKQSRGLIVCDTNAFATTIWQERYMGKTTDEVAKIAENDRVDLYILTGDEIPFVQDGTRDGEHIRHDMQATFLKALEAQNVPFVVVHGSKEERVKQAIEALPKISRPGFTLVFEQLIKRS